jgi:hypothetical protein
MLSPRERGEVEQAAYSRFNQNPSCSNSPQASSSVRCGLNLGLGATRLSPIVTPSVRNG